MSSFLEKLTLCHNRPGKLRRFELNGGECDNSIFGSILFLHIQKNLLIELQEHLEQYCNALPVFGFKIAKKKPNLFSSHLFHICVNEWDIGPALIEKANQFILFKIGHVQFSDKINFPGGARSLNSFLKAYKTSETKGFFLYEKFDHPEKMQKTELLPNDAFDWKFRSCNPVEVEYSDYVNLIKSGLTTGKAVVKLKLSKPPPTGVEIFQYLQQIWKQEQVNSFKDFVRWYNKKMSCQEDFLGGTFIVFGPQSSGWCCFFGSLQTYANQLSGLMLPNYNCAPCINRCRSVFVGIGIWIQRKVDSHFNKTLSIENMVPSFF